MRPTSDLLDKPREAASWTSRRSLALLAGILLLASAAGARAHELLEIYHLAQTRDAVLQASIFERDAVIEARPQARAQLLPQLGATASAAHERQGFGADALAPGGYSLNPHAYGLSLTQVLWSAESFNRLKEADLIAAGAQAKLLGAEQSLLLRVASAYFAILAARDQLETSRGARRAFSDLLEQARIRETTGIGPRSAVAQAQSFFDATEQGVIDAQNTLDDADLAMTQLIGESPSRIAPLRAEIPLAAPDPASIDDWVAAARDNNPLVRVSALQAQAAERDISVQRGRAWPTLTLNAGTSRTWQDEALGGKQTFDAVGVSFNWPLFQGGAVASAVRQSHAVLRQTQALLESAQRDTERQTRAAYRRVVSGIGRITAARRAVDSGREAVDASRRNVEFGAGSVFDLLNAQNNYYGALRAYSQTRYDYLTALLTLKQQAGNLAERDLASIDELLVETGP